VRHLLPLLIGLSLSLAAFAAAAQGPPGDARPAGGAAAVPLGPALRAALAAQDRAAAARLLQEVLPREPASAALLGLLEPWLLHPDPELAMAAIAEVQRLAEEPAALGEAEPALSETLAVLAERARRPGALACRVAALDAYADLATAWGRRLDEELLRTLAGGETPELAELRELASVLLSAQAAPSAGPGGRDEGAEP